MHLAAREEPGFGPGGVEDRRGVALRQHEAVVLIALRRLRIEAHLAEEERRRRSPRRNSTWWGGRCRLRSSTSPSRCGAGWRCSSAQRCSPERLRAQSTSGKRGVYHSVRASFGRRTRALRDGLSPGRHSATMPACTAGLRGPPELRCWSPSRRPAARRRRRRRRPPQRTTCGDVLSVAAAGRLHLHAEPVAGRHRRLRRGAARPRRADRGAAPRAGRLVDRSAAAPRRAGPGRCR